MLVCIGESSQLMLSDGCALLPAAVPGRPRAGSALIRSSNGSGGWRRADALRTASER
jgi:hypothetical protein